MSTELPAEWAKDQQVPTSTVTVKGVNGAVVATLSIVGSVDAISTTYPYKSSITPT
jgi:hypothetical protein